ncbi:hypothetical protein D3C81_2293580 [compost metagenome]
MGKDTTRHRLVSFRMRGTAGRQSALSLGMGGLSLGYCPLPFRMSGCSGCYRIFPFGMGGNP